MNQLIAGVFAVLITAGVSDQKIGLQGIRCPVTGDQATAEFSVDYKGGKVYVCCEAAVEAFLSDTAGFYAVKANLQLAATGQAIQVFCPNTGHLVDLERTKDIGGLRVAFCSSACQEEVSKAQPTEQIDRVFGNKAFAKAFRIGIKCPVCGHAAKGEVTYPYKNGRVFFCCDAGPEAFMSDVQGYFAAKANHQLVATGQATQVACPLTGRPAKPELKLDVSGVTVAFCSQACKTRAEKAEECARIELLFGNGVFDQGFRIRGGAAEIWDGTIVQFGKMHEAIGRQQNEGRVQVGALLERPHFFGIGALAKLKGEATIVDGTITLTRVDAKGQLEPRQPAPLDDKATLLIGAYVPSWSEQKVTANVGPDEFDHYIAESATRTGIKTSAPFVFTVEGEFRNVRLHVINGACPMHARLKEIAIPKEFQPFEAEFENVRGTVVGVFAKDAVGDITHPATSTHVHLVFKDDKSNNTVTGHVEQIGLREGAVLRLPKSK